MNRQTKPAFSNATETVFADALDLKENDMDAKDLGIEFVHFDSDGKIENQHTMPLEQFISDTPLSSQDYLITRSLVAARAEK
jgi:hypothetical protein